MTEASDGKRTRQLYLYAPWLLCCGTKGAVKPRIAVSSLHVDNLGSENVRRHFPLGSTCVDRVFVASDKSSFWQLLPPHRLR